MLFPPPPNQRRLWLLRSALRTHQLNSIADAARGRRLAQRAAAGKLWMPQAQRVTRGHDSSLMQIRARSKTTQETECSSTIRTGGKEKKNQNPPLTQNCVDNASREVEERLAHLDFPWYL